MDKAATFSKEPPPSYSAEDNPPPYSLSTAGAWSSTASSHSSLAYPPPPANLDLTPAPDTSPATCPYPLQDPHNPAASPGHPSPPVSALPYPPPEPQPLPQPYVFPQYSPGPGPAPMISTVPASPSSPMLMPQPVLHAPVPVQQAASPVSPSAAMSGGSTVTTVTHSYASVQVRIILPKLVYTLEEVVSGQIELICPQNVSLERVTAEIFGREYTFTRVIRPKSAARGPSIAGPQNRANTLAFSENLVHFHTGPNHAVDILTKATITPGTHSYSFSLPTHRWLPSTFCAVRDERRLSFAVAYSIKVRVVESAERIFDFQRSICLFRAPSPAPPRPFVSNDSSDVFFSRKKITWQVQIPKRTFFPGEVVPLSIRVDNQTSRAVRNIHLSFHRIYHCTFVAAGHFAQRTKISFQHTGKALSKQSITDLALSFVVPQDALPSTLGTLFRVSYELHVSLEMAMTSDPVIKLPLEVDFNPADADLIQRLPRMYMDFDPTFFTQPSVNTSALFTYPGPHLAIKDAGRKDTFNCS
ncbi:hypothetical protein H696_03727 [Fonticula alba]|uniref:Arrestin C-terminal-like domain-containing protein n=1 Tax=Fonticula alba TaxID=691883 RepID=A0A058Z584_FONAL|nr:hypothetical protein H696_03727 [Fonticula alba]KCV69291.1 hypothetical protein H696_03727 [Fonticula alba]|eukprot:XP_009495856.1 hypothetical protein H696_03727 [Fonticula alba]